MSQLRLSFSALERALDRQLAAISNHSQGLIGRNTLEDQSASAEQQARIFLDAAEGLRISAAELLGKRVGEVELAVVQRQDALEVVRARLRQVMAAGDSALLPNEQRPLEAARAKVASAVARAEWALKAAKLALEAKVVRAPADGVITSVALQERTTLARNEVVGIVEDLDGLVFKAMVPERELSFVALGQQVHLSIDLGDLGDHGDHRQAVEGRVSWIGRGGVVIDKAERSWNVLVAVEGSSATLMPALMPGLGGRAEIVLGRTTGLERLRELMRPSPPPVRRYLNPELPDPTLVLRARPEPTAPSLGKQELSIDAQGDSPAPTPTRLADRRGR